MAKDIAFVVYTPRNDKSCDMAKEIAFVAYTPRNDKFLDMAMEIASLRLPLPVADRCCRQARNDNTI